MLFSGGQDSTACLAWALARYGRVETVAFDYGQRHRIELDCRLSVREELARRFPDWRARMGEDHRLDLALEPGVLGDAIARIGEDPAFARRQGGVARVAKLVERTGLVAALPAAWVTPMVAIVVRPA